MDRRFSLVILLLGVAFAHQPVFATPSQSASQPEKCQKEGSPCANLPEPYFVDGMFKIKPPAPDMTVARANKISLDLPRKEIRHVDLEWQYSEPGVDGDTVRDSEAVVLEYAADRTPYVNFTPSRLGKVRLRVMILFGDGAVSDDSVEANVDRLPDRPPMAFVISMLGYWNTGRRFGTFHLDLSPQFNHETLVPAAFYGPWVPLISIPAAVRNEMSFTVITRPNEEPPFAFDLETGELKAVKLGQALLKVTLRNKSAYACVDVGSDAREFAQHSNCNDFLPADVKGPLDPPLEMPKPVQPVSQ